MSYYTCTYVFHVLSSHCETLFGGTTIPVAAAPITKSLVPTYIACTYYFWSLPLDKGVKTHYQYDHSYKLFWFMTKLPYFLFKRSPFCKLHKKHFGNFILIRYSPYKCIKTTYLVSQPILLVFLCSFHIFVQQDSDTLLQNKLKQKKEMHHYSLIIYLSYS